MRPLQIVVLLSITFLWGVAGPAQAEVNAGISIGEDGIKGFYLAIGEHYQVPDREIAAIREKKVWDEELPVVFYLANRAGVTPEAIIKLRLAEKSWMDITLSFGLNAEIFYVPVTVDPGPPYGKAYGHYKNRERHEWGQINLPDADVVNMVNLKFMSDYYKCPADDIIKLRQQGKNFVDINSQVKKNKKQAEQNKAKQASKNESKQQNKGKGKNK